MFVLKRPNINDKDKMANFEKTMIFLFTPNGPDCRKYY